MKKNELTDGMILETRDGKRYLLINDIMRDFDNYIGLNSYNNDLSYKRHTDYDIVKVYKDTMAYSLRILFKDKCLSLIWEREEIKLTDNEIEILKALKVLGYKFLARDEDTYFYSYNAKPCKVVHGWVLDLTNITDGKYKTYIRVNSDAFDFIKWEDKEPTSIDDLLKELEK